MSQSTSLGKSSLMSRPTHSCMCWKKACKEN